MPSPPAPDAFPAASAPDFAALVARLGAPVAPSDLSARLTDLVAATAAALGAPFAALTLDAGAVDSIDGDAGSPTETLATGTPSDAALLHAAVAEARGGAVVGGAASGTFAAVVEGIEDVAGVLAVQGATAADAPVRLLRLAALAGRFVAFRAAAGALAGRDARARAILETSVDGVVTMDAEGTVESFNVAAERIFGYDAAHVVGRDVSMLMPEPYRSQHGGYLQRYLDTGERKIIGIGREVTGLRGDGTVFPMELAVSEVFVGGQRVFTGLVRDISDRRALEHEVLRASEDERRRIGQDLHDGLGQMLTGLSLIAGTLARRIRTADAALGSEVADLASMMREADQYARTLAHGLVPVDLEQGGLAAALERLAQSAERLFGVACTFESRGAPPFEDATAGVHLYRIAQEAVSNAVRHGGARRVAIALVLDGGGVRLSVDDDGDGFGADVLDRPDRGIGLRVMHYRARLIGAALDLDTTPGRGTRIVCRLSRDSDTPARSLEEQLRDLARRPRAPRPAR